MLSRKAKAIFKKPSLRNKTVPNSSCFKILSDILFTCLSDFLVFQGMIPAKQHSFRREKSTTTDCISFLLPKIRSAFNTNCIKLLIYAVLVYFKAAFDIAPRERIPFKPRQGFHSRIFSSSFRFCRGIPHKTIPDGAAKLETFQLVGIVAHEFVTLDLLPFSVLLNGPLSSIIGKYASPREIFSRMLMISQSIRFEFTTSH